MEDFELGDHVVVELAEADGGMRRIAGYLLHVDEGGVQLKATHKDVPAVHVVSDEARARALAGYRGASWLGLKLEMLKRGEYPDILRRREWTEEYLTALDCAEIVEEATERKKYTFYEYKMPVLTYIAASKIDMIESSDDLADDLDVLVSAQTIDGEIEELLEGGIPPRAKDENERVMDDDGIDGKEEQQST
jgi:hypothetical protein